MSRRRKPRKPPKQASPAKKEVPTKPGFGWVGAAVLLAIGITVALIFLRDSDEGVEESAAASEYVDATACIGCHQDVWKTYQHTGMARSFYRPTDQTAGEAQFYHAASDRHYAMVERDGRFFQRQHQVDSHGRETNVLEREIHFVMGSGNHARSYLHLDGAGKLTQLPLGWYAEDGGSWGMSPGYDRVNHDGFQRVVSFDCMFCHNGYPQVAEGEDLPGRRARYTGAIPEGIDCQRCHGPGSEHIASGGQGFIVNPAKLSAEAQMDVCMQCHLETTSRPLPNVVHRYGRGYFSFRPGEALRDYALYFDHAPGTGWDDKFEINYSAYRLREAPCFLESEGRLTCATCHNPHEPAGSVTASRGYDLACLGCHTGLTGHGGRERECAGCHMPARRTDDVVHAVMTDHRIVAEPAVGLTTPKREKSKLEEIAYRGEVAPYYPVSLSGADGELYSALAQVGQGSNLGGGIPRLEAAIRKYAPSEAGFYFELGVAHEAAGHPQEAAAWFGRALELEPDFALARLRRGAALSLAGDFAAAEDVLSRADQTDARVLKERGLNFTRQGQPERAAESARVAIRLEPDLPELHNNLGGALAELGRVDEAEQALRQAIRLQPDLVEARFNLGTILAERGETAEAVEHWKQAIRVRPGYAAVRLNYGVVLAQAERYAEALVQLNAAVEADPDLERARKLRDGIRALVNGVQ